ncbi:MAG: hypothetical protein ACU836_16070 [Gammaproteobacteria bacterium]
MASQNTELDAWLAGEDIFASYELTPENWVAGFDPDRQVVEMKLGPFKRLYLRPAKFTQRFYHQVYPLTVEAWPYRKQVKLFDDFCRIEIALDLRFQATLEYVNRNTEVLDRINTHIQHLYASIIEDKINLELSRLDDGTWVQNGLIDHERNIALSVCEILTQQHIQAEAICKMSASFRDFAEVRLGKDSVYLHVLKKTFEISEETGRERIRQQRFVEQQTLQSKQQELAHAKELAEMQRLVQLQEAEAQVQLLLDKEQQMIRQLEVEERLHVERVDHENKLKTISFEKDLELQQQLEVKRQAAEIVQLNETLAHKALVEERQTQAEILRQQLSRRLWLEAERRDRAHVREDGDEEIEST